MASLSLYLDFDGDLQSCHNSPTYKETLVWCWTTCPAKYTVRQCTCPAKYTVRQYSTLIAVIYDSLTSRRQLCSAAHQPVQDSSGFVDSFSLFL